MNHSDWGAIYNIRGLLVHLKCTIRTLCNCGIYNYKCTYDYHSPSDSRIQWTAYVRTVEFKGTTRSVQFGRLVV